MVTYGHYNRQKAIGKPLHHTILIASRVKKTDLGHTNRTADQNSPDVSMEPVAVLREEKS